MNFTKRQIEENEEAVSLLLKEAREQKNLNLAEVAQKLNIREEYLSFLESGEYQKLPGGVYEKTFLKKYSAWLGLDAEKIEILYSRERGRAKNEKGDIFAKKKISKNYFLVFPKIIRSLFAALAILALFLYLGFCLKNSLSLPKMDIFEPPDDLITESNVVEVVGRANPKTQININDKLALKDENGNFREKIELKKGLNIITISAQNKYGRQNIIKKQILVK